MRNNERVLIEKGQFDLDETEFLVYDEKRNSWKGYTGNTDIFPDFQDILLSG